MHHPQIHTYRSLESRCRHLAEIAATPATRTALEQMALEYKQMADSLERQWRVTEHDHQE